MTNKVSKKFIALMALLISLTALSIDSVLPGMSSIAKELGVSGENSIQYIISVLILGKSFGLLFFGPISDAYGRKLSIYIGIIIYVLGCLASALAPVYEVMLLGRFFQGVGAASCRVVTSAMIRDQYEGNAMAKVMSFIMIVFVMVPALAPSVGQLIIFILDWRSIFLFMSLLSLVALAWLYFGQEETLKKENRIPFLLSNIKSGALETLKNKKTRTYMLISGLVFGSIVAYISSVQQIFQDQYKLGELFPVAFGSLALFIGIASFANARWVERLGAKAICVRSLLVIIAACLLFLPYCYMTNGHPLLYLLFIFFGFVFFCLGLLFGNLSSLALQPMGHIAGVANSVITSLQSLIAVFFGGYIGSLYQGSVLPLIIGFAISAVLSYGLIKTIKN